MKRTFYCTYDSLRRICADEHSWQYRFLKSLSAIYVFEPETHALPSEDQYLKDSEEYTPATFRRKEIDVYEEKLSTAIVPFKDLGAIDYSRLGNSIIAGMPLSDDVASKCGIEVSADLEMKALCRHWFESANEGEKRFTWDSYFKKGKLPLSNSAIFIDRYLFTVKTILSPKTKEVVGLEEQFSNGAKNVAEVLKAIIPKSYCGVYSVLLVFDGDQVEKRTTSGDYIPLKDAIKRIGGIITNAIPHKSSSLNLEFLSIHDGKNYVKGKDTPEFIQANMGLKKLYDLTHDRRLITNNYIVNATHGWNAIDYNLKYKGNNNRYYLQAKETQTFYFDALCSGFNNNDQINIPNSIPIDFTKQFMDQFVYKLKCLDGICECFRYQSGQVVDIISISKLTNGLLSLATPPSDPLDYLFKRNL